MTPQERSWIEEVLGVRPPWQVHEVRVAAAERLVTVHIGPALESAGWFWGKRRTAPAPGGGRRLRWSHLQLAGQPCQVQLALGEGQSLPDALWAGDPELPFTHALSRRVLDLMLGGATMEQLCLLLELPLGDLWKYKFRLDQGSARAPRASAGGRGTAPAATPAPATALAATPPRAETAAVPVPSAALPPEQSPVWVAVLKGQVVLDVQALSLKLLLSKLMREAQSHQDADLHRQAGQVLWRYFVRNQGLLAHEAEQIQAAARLPSPESDALPDVSDPLWAALLAGEHELDVRTLSLRLLLTKLRQQARGIQDDDVRMLQLVDLHRFFKKHHAVLRHEIAQIRQWSAH